MSMPVHPSRKFDPARADVLDSAARDEFLPDHVLVDLLELRGQETLLDYGAGTGRVALAAAAALPQGRVIAVDESPEMVTRLQVRTQSSANIEVLQISGNHVPLADATVDRILAINLLHEVRGESALSEMLRLLRPDGVLLAVDWDRERPSEPGPPTEHRYSAGEAQQELAIAGFSAERVASALPYHFVLRARPATR